MANRFWLNLLDDGGDDTLILRKNRYDNTQTSQGTALAWSVAVSNNINTGYILDICTQEAGHKIQSRHFQMH